MMKTIVALFALLASASAFAPQQQAVGAYISLKSGVPSAEDAAEGERIPTHTEQDIWNQSCGSSIGSKTTRERKRETLVGPFFHGSLSLSRGNALDWHTWSSIIISISCSPLKGSTVFSLSLSC